MRAWVLLAFGLAVQSTCLAQSFSGNFEHLQPNGVPTQWTIADPSGAAATNDAHLGKRAAKAWVYRNYASGQWVSRTDAENNNAANVSGYYKYLGEKNECERAEISYLLGAWDEQGGVDTLAFGETELKLSKNYKKFSLSVEAVSGGTPELMSIQFKPKGHCNVHGEENCCFLYVDDIILEGSTDLTQPVEDIPSEENGSKTTEVEEPTPAPNAPVENKVPMSEEPEEEKEAVPAEEETPAAKEVPAPEPKVVPAAVPADEKEPVEETPTEPVEEGWNSEESSDGGR